MAEKPLYQSFILISPWIGTFHYFTLDLTYCRKAIEPGARLFQKEGIKVVDRVAYEMAYREACRQAGED